MNTRMLLLSIVIMLSCCVSAESKRESFENSRNFYIGKMIYEYGDTPYKVETTSDPGIKNYHYKDSEGCEWMVTVELQTIKSWKYVSAPDLCVLKVNWGGPW